MPLLDDDDLNSNDPAFFVPYSTVFIYLFKLIIYGLLRQRLPDETMRANRSLVQNMPVHYFSRVGIISHMHLQLVVKVLLVANIFLWEFTCEFAVIWTVVLVRCTEIKYSTESLSSC